jgi:hypothetical protein
LAGVLLATTVAALVTLIGGGTAHAATAATPAAVGNNYQLLNVTTQKCADVKDQSRFTGAIVHQWDCVDQDSQRWSPRDAGNGYMTLQNQNSGWCMAVKDDVNASGTQIIQTECNAADPGQLWRQDLLDVSGTSNVVSALGKCLEVNRADRSNGAKIQIWTCSTASNAQAWQFR